MHFGLHANSIMWSYRYFADGNMARELIILSVYSTRTRMWKFYNYIPIVSVIVSAERHVD